MTLRCVRKRDGRLVPFDATKIEVAVASAMAAAGEEDPPFAREVAEVVRLELEHRQAAAAEAGDAAAPAPGIETIQDLVERSLVELGRAGVAKAYILHRDRRARIRGALEVRVAPGEASLGSEGSEPGLRRARRRVRVQESRGTSGWSKGRIVAALMNEADLPRRVAEDVAARVERRVFAAGMRRITTSLVRELVDNELVGLGLASALRRQGLVGLPRHDLREVLRGADAAGASVEERVSGELLARYALEEVFDEATCERHLAGDLELVGLGRPHRLLATCVPAELLRGGGDPARDAFAVLPELAALARTSTAGLVLEEAGGLLGSLRGRGALDDWLAALAAVGQAAGARVDLAGPGPRATSSTARLVQALAERSGPDGPRLFLDADELEALLEQEPEVEPPLERCLAEGRVVPTWAPRGERVVGPGCRRRARERAAVSLGGAVALNLPRLAWRAGPWREDRLLELLAELVEGALTALESLAALQERARPARPGELRGRVAHALVPVGVREALKLVGDGEVRADQGARLLGLLCDAAERLGAAHRLSVEVTPFFGEAAARRFAALDAALPQHAQKLLFDEGVGAGLQRAQPYSSGFALAGAEARLCSTVPAGALHPFPAPTATPGAAETPLSTWRRFLEERAGGAQSAVDDAGLPLRQEELFARWAERRDATRSAPTPARTEAS